MLNIKGFIETSFIDWEGHISAVVFLGGCNFACPFCHNAELIQPSPAMPTLAKEKILARITEKRTWIDGVVISGGEPCLQQNIVDFIREIKDLGFPVKLDTNGSEPKMLNELVKMNLVDYVAMDIKAPLTEQYQKLSGKNIELGPIKQSIEILLNTKHIDYEFRTTVVPDCLSKENIVTIAAAVQGSKRYVLQQFNPKETLDTSLQSVKPYSSADIDEIIAECKKFIPNTYIRY